MMEAFPVSAETSNRQCHSFCVLEFFSSLSRQRETQLLKLPRLIGALVMQTADRNYFYHLLDTHTARVSASGQSN